MKKIVALAALVTTALLSSNVMAADEASFYGGVVVGSTKFKIDADSDKKTSFGVHLGYNFNANFAVEVQAQRLGKWSDDVDTLTARSLNASVLAKLPVSDTISLFARAGWGRNTFELTEGKLSASLHSNKALVGVGADFKVASNIALRAEYVNLGSNDIGYGVNVKMQQFNVGANFSF